MGEPSFNKGLFECIPAEGTFKHTQLLKFCKQNHSQILATIPFVASEVAEFCGFYAFFELLRQFGGSKINLAGGPEKLWERYGLYVSSKDYQKLMLHTEYDWVELPSAWGVFMALRRTAIIGELVRPNFLPSVGPLLNRTLAKKYGVSERYVRKLSRTLSRGADLRPG